MKKYIEPSIEEGQRIAAIWGRVTNKPITSREIMFYREIIAANEIERLRSLVNPKTKDQ